jgi:serine/threonine protein kinase
MDHTPRPAAASVDHFVKSMVDSGVMEAQAARQAVNRIPAGLRGDARTLAQELVKQQKLTAYQAGKILRDKAGKLALGPYVILEELGEGGMGVVFKARHRGTNRAVALKVLSAEVTGQDVALKRFRREARAAAKLSHPNIVAALDTGDEQGTHFFAMEYVQGCDLARWVRQHGPLPVGRAVDCVLQAARGLAAAHAAGIVHRDIKPSNLLLTEAAGNQAAGTIKVLDLGLARIGKAGERAGNETTLGDLTQTGSIMGTSDYMAPEQALNAKTADERADIYSLGCTLYFLVTGKPMYQGETMMEKVFAHREMPIPPLPGAGRALQAVFQRMLAKDPGQRYPSMAETIAALQACCPAQASTSRRSRRVWWLAGSAAVAATLLVAWLLGRGRDDAAVKGPAPSSKSAVVGQPAAPQSKQNQFDIQWRIATTAPTNKQQIGNVRPEDRALNEGFEELRKAEQRKPGR